MRRSRWLAALGALGTWVLLSARAQAQEAPVATEPPPVPPSAEAAPAAPVAPDVVRLKNGGLLRGTISELLPGDSVTIIALSGTQHRVAMSDVSYAGPTANDPTVSVAPPPARKKSPPDSSTRARPRVIRVEGGLHLTSEPSGLTFYRLALEGVGVDARDWSPFRPPTRNFKFKGYEPLCTAPCDTSLPVGTYRFALAFPDGSPVEAEGELSLNAGPSSLHGRLESHATLRGLGWAALIAGVAGGVALTALAFKTEPCPAYPSCREAHVDSTLTALGVGSALLGGGVAIVLVRIKDEATIEPSERGASGVTQLGAPLALSLRGTM